jgi:hypothetical protein
MAQVLPYRSLHVSRSDEFEVQLPTRLLRVGDESIAPFLYESGAGERGSWAALSTYYLRWSCLAAFQDLGDILS